MAQHLGGRGSRVSVPKLLETLYQKATHIYKIQMNIILFNSKIVTITTLSPPPQFKYAVFIYRSEWPGNSKHAIFFEKKNMYRVCAAPAVLVLCRPGWS